ncbi:MAG: transposase [Spirochaetes bacterium]|nr:transposase [Spirochaetota bacterium]
MPRKHRICISGATYHTTSRCIEKKHLMKLDKMKELMNYVLNMAQEKYKFELNNHTIMDNHFHFYITTLPDGENISRIMQFIKSQYARRYNRMTNRIGPFWNERFSDTIIELTSNPFYNFFYILFYIAYNPVRSHHVSDPRDYTYSGFKCYFDETYIPAVKITLHKYFLSLGNNFDERVKKLLEYEENFKKRIFSESIFS